MGGSYSDEQVAVLAVVLAYLLRQHRGSMVRVPVWQFEAMLRNAEGYGIAAIEDRGDLVVRLMTVEDVAPQSTFVESMLKLFSDLRPPVEPTDEDKKWLGSLGIKFE